VVALAFLRLRLLGMGDLRALLRGGRLVVVPESVAHEPEGFHDFLVSQRVNVLTQTPLQ